MYPWCSHDSRESCVIACNLLSFDYVLDVILLLGRFIGSLAVNSLLADLYAIL